MPDLDKIHSEILRDLSPKDTEGFRAGLKALGLPDPFDRAALKAVFKQLYVGRGVDDATADKMADISAKGRGQ